MIMRSIGLRILMGVIFTVVFLLALGFWLLRASLPTLTGTIPIAGLSQTVEINRDEDGVVTVHAATDLDEALAMGYVHAQDRFFQMDLARRLAAGELSELVGSAALKTDKKVRVHRFRARAAETLAHLSTEERALLAAYTNGVNQALKHMTARPFEYWVLRQKPRAWQMEDTILVVDSMFLQLQQSDGHHHLQQGLIEQQLPTKAWQFVLAEATEWDAAQDGSVLPAAVLPEASEWNLREPANSAAPPEAGREGGHSRERPVIGSNNWAIAGFRTKSGAAIVSNDMHLGIRVPNTWYRMQLRCACREQGFVLTGVTLPGAPIVVVGSNGHVAWGFTNSYGDFQNVIALNQDGLAERLYRTTEGIEALKTIHETILVKHEPPVDLPVIESRFGPVIETTTAGQKLVLQWAAHSPLAINLHLNQLATARNVAQAMAIAQGAGIPAQNFMVGDSEGHIGWTVAGQIPKRTQLSRPIVASDEVGVDLMGFIDPAIHPQLLDPKDGQLVTANARVVGGAALAVIGDGGYDRGARALQIMHDLQQKPTGWTELDSLNVALDDRSVFLTRWKDYLLNVLDHDALDGHPRRVELKTALERYSGHAAVDDAGYRLTRVIRENLEHRLFNAAIGNVKQSHPQFDFSPPASFEGPLWQWLNQQPMHLLPSEYPSYRALVLTSIDEVLNDLTKPCPSLAGCTWGQINTLDVRHPLAASMGPLGQYLNMPAQMMPGDKDMPRAQGPAFGASERMAVSPGHESQGIFEMPTGQSGHPLSPFYRQGHEHWVKGDASPFLPKTTRFALTLMPAETH